MALAYDAQHERGETGDEEQEERRNKLVLMLKAEEEESLGYAESEVTGQQIEALKRYYGEPYGDEEEGRSQVTTREVQESVEWTRPDLIRIFSGPNICSVQELSEEGAKGARDAEDYLNWIFAHDNPGFRNLDSFAFDGLLHRRGYLAVYWRDKEYSAPQRFTGLNIMQVQEIANDPRVEIIGQDFDQETEAGGIGLVVRRTKTPARAVIESVAPEDMRLNGRAVTIDTARYVGRVTRMLAGEAMRLWPDMSEEILAAAGKAASAAGFSRRAEDVRAQRFKDDSNDWTSGSEEAQEIEVLEEYLRVDLDDDGYPELIRSYRIGDVLLEEGEVEENPFASWAPIHVPHRFMGLSLYDLTQDLQRQNTVIMRGGLDAFYQAVVPREFYDQTKVDENGAAALLSTVAGVKIGVNGNPNDVIKQAAGGVDTTKVAWDALAINKQRLEDRTGATRQTRGLDSDQLTKEHSGKALGMLQLNADARKEMIARNMAAGLSDLFGKLYRLVCRNQNEPRQVKVGGKAALFDPKTWDSDLTVSVHSGGLNREHSLMALQLIAQEQEKVLEFMGPNNPNVKPKNRFRYQEELCRVAGFKSAEPFFTDVPDVPETGPDGQPVVDPETGEPKMKAWEPPPQPSPEMAKIEADAKQAQAGHELKKEEAAVGLQLQQQKNMAAEAESAAKIQLMREEAAARIQIMREEAALKAQTTMMQLEADRVLAERKMDQDRELEIMRIESAERIGKAKASASDSGSAPSVDAEVNGQ